MEPDVWKEKILRCYKNLVVTDLYRAIDDCYSGEVLTTDEKDTLDTIATPSDKNRQFLKILLHKSEDSYHKFLHCLTSDFSEIRTLIIEEDVKKALETDENTLQYRRQIYLHCEDILQQTSLRDITDDFISQRVFGIEDWEKITNTHLTTTEQNRTFLNILLTQRRGYFLFLSTLRRMGHGDLVSQIEGTKVGDDVDKEIESYLWNIELENMGVRLDLEEISPGRLLSWKEEDDIFCPTTSTGYIYNEAVNKRKVIVSGLPGAGKSASIHHIALQLKGEGRRLCCVRSVKDMVEKMDRFRKEEKQVYVFDDVFGVHGLDENKRKEWCDENKDDVERCLRNPDVTILCTLRLQVLQDRKVSNIISKFSVINISHGKNELSSEERVDIFRKHASSKSRVDLLTEKVEQTIRGIVCPTGCFPLVCRLYTGDRETKQSILTYFSKPLYVIADHLEKLNIEDRLGHFCLLMCLIYDNNLPVYTLEVGDEMKETKKLRKELLEICKIHTSTSREEIRDKMDTLIKTFVKREENSYQFVHDMVYDTVIKHVNDLPSSVHKVILRHCSLKFVKFRVRLSTVKCEHSESCINIRPDLYVTWAERLLHDIGDGICMSDYLYQDIKEGQCNLNDDPRVWRDNPWRDIFYRNPCVFTEEGEKAISEALDKKSASDITSLMCTPGFSMYRGTPRHTALHWVTWGGLNRVVTQIMKVISQKSLQEVDSIEDLLWMAFRRHRDNRDMIQTLIEQGEDVNKRDTHGHTPLWLSVYDKDYQTIEWLIKHGADVNQCMHGRSLLFELQLWGNEPISELLKSHGALFIFKEREYTDVFDIPGSELEEGELELIRGLKGQKLTE